MARFIFILNDKKVTFAFFYHTFAFFLSHQLPFAIFKLIQPKTQIILYLIVTSWHILNMRLIFLIIVFNVRKCTGNNCDGDACVNTIDIPLVTKLNAPLKAEFDISTLNTQLKTLIEQEVKREVKRAVSSTQELQLAEQKLESKLSGTITSALQRLQGKTYEDDTDIYGVHWGIAHTSTHGRTSIRRAYIPLFTRFPKFPLSK